VGAGPQFAPCVRGAAMTLNAARKKSLRAAAHALKPVVMMGQRGYTPAIVAAIDEALTDHELIKVRVRGAEREERKPLIEAICRDLDAEFVALVGSVATLYRERPADDAVKLKTTKGL
ncbi:MAG: ribosome assembly RNA-binding protein YhbY, partial [Gammaproteobacteria bacterium]